MGILIWRYLRCQEPLTEIVGTDGQRHAVKGSRHQRSFDSPRSMPYMIGARDARDKRCATPRATACTQAVLVLTSTRTVSTRSAGRPHPTLSPGRGSWNVARTVLESAAELAAAIREMSPASGRRRLCRSSRVNPRQRDRDAYGRPGRATSPRGRSRRRRGDAPPCWRAGFDHDCT
jgi:hypothetical protein